MTPFRAFQFCDNGGSGSLGGMDARPWLVSIGGDGHRNAASHARARAAWRKRGKDRKERTSSNPVLPLFVFIDACGWEIIKQDPFVRRFALNRRRLTSSFGYSSACVPSILSGRWPAETPELELFRRMIRIHSPLRSLARSPVAAASVDRAEDFSAVVVATDQAWFGFIEGYFDLYNTPLKRYFAFQLFGDEEPASTARDESGDEYF